nr:pyridoxamine 5'-phosphate oxidase family protein [uncultured Blautia sp.]
MEKTDLSHEEYEEAASYWKKKDAESVKLDEAKLKKAVEEYILANKTCALATGAGEFVRCTPIEYTYHHGAFWMFSEGGEKFAALEKNKNVCLAIFDKYEGFGKLKGMQVAGEAELVAPFSDEYNAAAEFRKIPLDALRKMPHTMNLIKVQPKKIEFLNSDFKKDGADSRQMLEF